MLRYFIRRRKRRREGQAMVEFALAIPFMIFLFVAVVEVARLLQVYSLITEIANDTARFWSRFENQALTANDVRDLARESLQGNNQDLSTVQVTAFEQPDPIISGLDQMVVQITYTIQPVAPLEIMGRTVLDPNFQVTAIGVYAKESDF